MSGLKPCPFCGSDSLYIDEYKRDVKSVICKECGGENYLRNWNNRFQKPVKIQTVETCQDCRNLVDLEFYYHCRALNKRLNDDLKIPDDCPLPDYKTIEGVEHGK